MHTLVCASNTVKTLHKSWTKMKGEGSRVGMKINGHIFPFWQKVINSWTVQLRPWGGQISVSKLPALIFLGPSTFGCKTAHFLAVHWRVCRLGPKLWVGPPAFNLTRTNEHVFICELYTACDLSLLVINDFYNEDFEEDSSDFVFLCLPNCVFSFSFQYLKTKYCWSQTKHSYPSSGWHDDVQVSRIILKLAVELLIPRQ